MIIAKIRVNGAIAKTVYRKVIPAGIIGAQVEFDYDEDIWHELHKTVVFKGAVTKDVVTDANIVTIPHEVVEKPFFQLSIGVYGVNADGNIVIPTLWEDIGDILDATTPSGDTNPDPDPSPPVWAQIQAMIGNLDELETTARNNLVAAVNEVAQSGGGGSTVELDTTLTQSGKAADAKAVGDALDELEAQIPESGGGGAGIYVGDTAPSDTSALWVDTSDNEGSTVDSVNGKTGTVVLTAEDVGAMPAGASVDYTLPVATAEKLGGVKVGEGLSIDASGVLSASGGGSSGGGGGVPTWSLLGEYDMSTIADSANISLTGLDNLTYLYFKWEALQNETSTDSNYWLSINGKQLGQYILSRKSGTSNYGYTICKWNGLVWEIQMSAGAISDTNYTLNTGNALFPYNHVFGVGACTTLSTFVANSTYKPVSGVLKIYGGK